MNRPVEGPVGVKALWFAAAVALQLFILVGMAADQMRVVAVGKAVRVMVKPVDPMSLFQGEYARLAYEFTSFDAKALEELGEGSSTFVKGEKVWVVLTPDQGSDGAGLWRPVALSRVCPAELDEKVAVRGEVSSFSSWTSRDWDKEQKKQVGPPIRHATLSLHTGLESFFVPQGEAAKLEREVREGETTAELAVLPSGRAAVRKLFVKGRDITF